MAFIIHINSGTDKQFIIPTSGKLNGKINKYNWKITWGDGTQPTIIVGSNTPNDYYNGIKHTYTTANTDYVITIEPVRASELGWLRAFGFGYEPYEYNQQENKDKVKLVDSIITNDMVSTSQTDKFICANMFCGCHNLSFGDSFTFDNSFVYSGDYFASNMFADCIGLTTLNNFNLPQTLSVIGDYFASNMFADCIGLTTLNNFNLPLNSFTTVGDYFCACMFRNCSSLTLVGTLFNITQTITSCGNGFCMGMFYGCSNIVLNDLMKLPLFNSSEKGLCEFMFADSGLTVGSKQVLENVLLSVSELDKEHVFFKSFANTPLNEVISPINIPLLSNEPNVSNACFNGCTEDKIIDCPTNWKIWKNILKGYGLKEYGEYEYGN